VALLPEQTKEIPAMKKNALSEIIDLELLTFEPLTKTNWKKFVQLFGNNGACGNCWCMFYRLKKADFMEGKINGKNKESMRRIVMKNYPTGILGFYKEQPIAWCAFAPREHLIRLENSRVHKRIDDVNVWSITCFFIDKNFRQRGISAELLKGVIEYARQNNIQVIEAYPTILSVAYLPDSFIWTGLYKTFKRVGFKVVNHTSKNRPMVRYYIN
jgi:GNAT superfamily N-acetyltransferase